MALLVPPRQNHNRGEQRLSGKRRLAVRSPFGNLLVI
ncbi:uncharacterized protein METZ01_LOCUS348965 [marine metagenome]|uniref:Uncharacterized protein n=1 Tax=marine metagenome TaxID=408172 RepID=A0A382RHL8_9ZZZZ